MNELLAEIGSFDKLLNAIFLLFLGTVGGMLGGGIMSCGIQKFVTENILVKHLFFFVIIYFTNTFVNSRTQSITTSFLQTLLIYILFILLMKSEKIAILIVIAMMSAYYIVKEQKKFYQKHEQHNKHIKTIEFVENCLVVGIIITTLIGFTLYAKRQYMERGDHFNFVTFLLGHNRCDGMMSKKK